MPLTIKGYLRFMKYLIGPHIKEEIAAESKKRNIYVRGGKSLVGVAIGTGKAGEIYELVKLSIESIGGIEKGNFRDKRVLVKPNVNSDDPFPATTNPKVVGAVVKLLLEAGAREVIVADLSNFAYNTLDAMRKTNILEEAEENGARVISFDEVEWVKVSLPESKYMKRLYIPKIVLEAERFVNVPVIKTHNIATYSISLKNFVGVIHPKNRYFMHITGNVEESIAEINLATSPDLIIVDGTKSMVSGGPFRGIVKDTNLILAGGDRVAVDAVGLSIIKSFNLWSRVSDKSIWDQKQIKEALKLGLGRGEGEIEVKVGGLSSEEKREEILETIESNLT